MRTMLPALIALVGSASGVLADNTIIPNAWAATPGTGTFTGQVSTAARTYQWLINANQLTALVGRNITGIAYRLPNSATAAWPTADVTYTNYDLFLSPGVDPAARSLTFAANVVGTQTQVRSGPLTIVAGSYPFGGAPVNAYGTPIMFGTPYPYTGGHLLIELRHPGFTGTTRSVDALTTSTAGWLVDYVSQYTASYTGTAGQNANFAIIDLIADLPPAACYPNCDASTTVPILNVQDFSCFLNKFASGDTYANCDGSTVDPILNVQDFACFLNSFSVGCS